MNTPQSETTPAAAAPPTAPSNPASPRRRRWLLAAAALAVAAGTLVARPPLALADHLPGPLMVRARLAEMNFTPQQREQAIAVLRRHAPTVMPVVKQLVRERRALRDMIRADRPDEAAIRAQAQRVGQVGGELSVLAARLAADLRPIATPEQQAQLRALQESVQTRVDAGLEWAERWLQG